MKKYTIPKAPTSVSDLMVAYDSLPASAGADLLMQQARSGLSMEYLHDLASKLGITLSEMSELLHVSLRTLQRYEVSKVLDVDLSSKLLLLSDLYMHGMSVMGEYSFVSWLRESVPALQGQVPLSMLDNPFGIRQVDDCLGQLEHGVFA